MLRVVAALLVDIFALPTNLEDANNKMEMPNIKTAENVADIKLKIDDENRNESMENTNMKLSFPENIKSELDTKDNEMEISPRILEESKKQDLNILETENKQETKLNKEQTIAAKKSDSLSMIEIQKDLVDKENTKEMLIELEPEALNIMETKNTQKVIRPKEEQTETESLINPVKSTTALPEPEASIQGIGIENLLKPTDGWLEFDDGKFSLLENRLPDLTDEEFREINKEGSIPLNFLKRFDITKSKTDRIKPQDQKLDMSPGEAKLETPVYITIPIVINSNSNLPISLNIGGQTIPLDVVQNMANLSQSSNKNTSIPSSATLSEPTLELSPTTPRETNRHRSNVRNKIYARNSQHEVFAYDRKL